jgi:hypothetical protein
MAVEFFISLLRSLGFRYFPVFPSASRWNLKWNYLAHKSPHFGNGPGPVQEYGHGKVLTVCAESIFGIRAPMSVLSLAALWYVLPVVKA